MTNPFSDRNNKLTNDIADVLAKNRQAKSDAIPDSIKNAAKAAGVELRNAGTVPVETKNSIYGKHFSNAVGASEVSPSVRSSFETLADQEFNTPPSAE